MERTVASVGKDGVKIAAAAAPAAVKKQASGYTDGTPICPFSGKPVVVEKMKVGQLIRYKVYGQGWVASRLFDSLDAAYTWLAPLAQKPEVRASITSVRAENIQISDAKEAVDSLMESVA